MSYREHDAHTHPEICDIPSYAEVHILNGLSTEIAIPCNYVTTDDAGVETFTEIHLTTEGYTDPVVTFASVVSGLSAEAWIDETDDHIIRVVFTAQCQTAWNDDLECGMSITITRDTITHGLRTDCVIRGLIKIKAAPFTVVEEPVT